MRQFVTGVTAGNRKLHYTKKIEISSLLFAKVQETIVIAYKAILVTTDLSSVANEAVRRASDFAKLVGAKLSLLHVLEHFPEDIPNYAIAPENMDSKTFYVTQAAEQLEELKNKLDQENVSVEVVVSTHSAGREITEYATAKNMDLIVVGSHGKHGFLGMAGSTASKVVQIASVDVLVVRLTEHASGE